MRLLIAAIGFLVSVTSYAAYPSYSNFNSNQFSRVGNTLSLGTNSPGTNGQVLTVVGGKVSWLSLATNAPGTDGQALLTDGVGALRFGTVATSGGSQVWTITNVTADFVASTNKKFAIANTDGGAFTVFLPTNATEGFCYAVKLIGTNSLTLTNELGSIDGASNVVLTIQYQARTLARESTNWWIY